MGLKPFAFDAVKVAVVEQNEIGFQVCAGCCRWFDGLRHKSS
jgi:hypothetical protein